MKRVMMLSIVGATHAFAPGKLPECLTSLSQAKLAVNRPSHARRNIASSPLTSHAYPSLILSLRMSDDSTGMWSQDLRPCVPYVCSMNGSLWSHSELRMNRDVDMFGWMSTQIKRCRSCCRNALSCSRRRKSF
jgi:hypothetical protein